jgi:hypothetical protein
MKYQLLFLVLISLVIAVMPLADAQTAPPGTPIPVYNTDGTTVPSVHIVVGSVTVPPSWASDVRSPQFSSGIPVTLEGAAAFTSADSYICFVSQLAGPNPQIGMFRKTDGSHFGIRAVGGGAAWRQDFLCIGN